MLQLLLLLWVYDGRITVSEAIQRNSWVMLPLTWTVMVNFLKRQRFWCYNISFRGVCCVNIAIIVAGWLLICMCAHYSAGHWLGVAIFCIGHIHLYVLNKQTIWGLVFLGVFFITNEARFEWISIALISADEQVFIEKTTIG